jgi:hypothetical protein
MESIELMLHENYSLLVLLKEDATISQFVICKHYNPDEPYGNQWSWGHYFETLEKALDYWNENILNRPCYDRLSELATLFKDGLVEDGMVEALEFFDESCEMTNDEKDYFGIMKWDEQFKIGEENFR